MVKNINDIKVGSKTDIIYLNDNVITFGPRTRKNITTENDAKLTEILSCMGDCSIKRELLAFQASEKYKAALRDGKTCPLDLGDAHIVKVSVITVGWTDHDALCGFYADRAAAVKAVREKHGFGKLLEEYAEGDWRFKHKGVGAEPEKSQKPATYKHEEGALYKSDDGVYAIRQFPERSEVAYWVFVDAKGAIERVPDELFGWMVKAYSSSKPKTEPLYEGDELAYVNDINSIPDYGRNELTLTLDNILCVKSGDTFIDNSGAVMEAKPYLKCAGDMAYEFHIN